MTTKSATASLTLLLAPLLLPVAWSQAWAGEHRFFCQWSVFYVPKSPNVRYKCICAKRICPCCPLENFGYYPACWQRWPFPPNYGHCPVPPIVLNAPQSPLDEPRVPESKATEELPPPSKESSESAPPEKTLPEPNPK